jgi:pimeloyl-ACP methyl ester carboxylesterase
MSEGRLTLRNGRTLAWRDYGPSDGRPLLRFQGTPGSRHSRYPHEEAYDRLGVHVIAFDRPGYGASTRLRGRGIAVVADDAAELLDHFGLDAVHVMGGSGGGPHALAFAANHPKRVRAVTVVVGGVPLEEEDLSGLIQLNRDGWYAAREGGWDAVYAILAPLREEILADPLAGFRATMAAAPASDKAVMDDPDWQRVLIEDAMEALRPGAEGWADEGLLFYLPWDFDPQKIGCSVTWWHGEHDANSPISAVRRLLEGLADVELRVWPDAGHLEAYRKHDEIVGELLSRG